MAGSPSQPHLTLITTWRPFLQTSSVLGGRASAYGSGGTSACCPPGSAISRSTTRSQFVYPASGAGHGLFAPFGDWEQLSPKHPYPYTGPPCCDRDQHLPASQCSHTPTLPPLHLATKRGLTRNFPPCSRVFARPEAAELPMKTDLLNPVSSLAQVPEQRQPQGHLPRDTSQPRPAGLCRPCNMQRGPPPLPFLGPGTLTAQF